MGFSTRQVRALKREVDHRKVRTRHVHGKDLSFLEGWHVIAEANRIFGFDGWTRETVETRCILNREVRGSFQAVYAAKVRITVFANGRTVVREGHGTGEGQGATAGETHDIALKAAETDATKRALATFGKPFGLSLYLTDRNRAGAGHDRRPLPPPRYRPTPPPAAVPSTSGQPISQAPATKALTAGATQSPDPAPCGPQLIEALQTPQSALPLGFARRIRDRNHLKFVTQQLCLKCARWPSHAHHITYAQPRATGMKVSDEFVVPLCRLHHREVHHARNELAWWTELKINPLEVANGLWRESHARLEKAITLKSAKELQTVEEAAEPRAQEPAEEQ